MRIVKIISSGKGGAERGALDAAIRCGLPYGGWIPKGRCFDEVRVPERYAYLLETGSSERDACLEANVAEADATIIFTGGTSPLLERTVELAAKCGKPCLHIDLHATIRQRCSAVIIAWLAAKCPSECVLHVSGPSDASISAGADTVNMCLVDVICEVHDIPVRPAFRGPDGTWTDAVVLTTGVYGERNGEADDPQHIAPHFPTTVAEAIHIVLYKMSPAQKDYVRSCPDREQFIMQQRRGLAEWIRNSMMYRNIFFTFLLADARKRSHAWNPPATFDADSVSGLIVGQVWDAFHGE